MEDEFLPYEEALALKEIGYKGPCWCYFMCGVFNPSMFPKNYEYFSKMEYLNKCEFVLAPLYQQAFKFFRKKYNLIHQIEYLFNGNYAVTIHKNTHEYMEKIQDLNYACVAGIPDNYSYEEAELNCIREMIEIIKTQTQ